MREGADVADCLVCPRLRWADPAPRDAIAERAGWRVSHAFGANLPGWLVVVPTRHVTSLDELTDGEAGALGGLLRAATSALRAVTGCEKTYVLLLAEAEGFAHVHFHVVPRHAEMDPAARGAKVFALLHNPELAVVDAATMDRLALAVRAHLLAAGAAELP